MLSFYQHLPEKINPFLFQGPFFSLRWYSLMFILAIFSVYFLLKIQKKKSQYLVDLDEDNLLIYLIIGIVIGGRLGYVFFYDWAYFSQHLWEIFWPWVKNNQGEIIFQGITGMSYHGGLIGAIIAGAIFCYRYSINFWSLADEIVLLIPLGYFWGRIGNFLNGELYGRPTQKPWGMYFQGENFLRHPSQLYEALGEGLILFGLLWKINTICQKKINVKKSFLNKICRPSGSIFLAYIFLYSLIRFMLEFVRQPDEQIGLVGGWLSQGQILSLIAIVLVIFIKYFFFIFQKENEK